MTAQPPSTGPLLSLRERRAQVIGELSQAFAKDRLDIDELDRRMEATQRAVTVAELDALVLDLVAVGERGSTALALRPEIRSLTSGVSVGGDDRPRQQTVVAMMGGVERKGRWVVPSSLRVHCIMGGVSLDFREANLAPGVSEILITCLMGGVEVIVPPNVAVDLSGSAILGGFDQSHRGADVLSTEPVAKLRITGVAIAGGVGVETRRIGETAREANRRIKQERKHLLDGGAPGQAALPAAVALPERKKR